MAAAPRIRCVDGYDVEIARETQVLKAVVKDEALGAERLDSVAAGADPIGVADHGG